MCQVHPPTPLLPTVCAEPPNDRGAYPAEYTTPAGHTAPPPAPAGSGGHAPHSSRADCNGRFVTTFVTLLGGQGFGQVVTGLTQTEHPLGATDVSLTATGAVPCPVP